MINRKNIGATTIVLICLTLSAIFGVVYAAFTKTLTINGSFTTASSKWDVRFTNISAPTITGGATVTTPPTISNQNAAQTNRFEIAFTKPGQSVSWLVTISNTGNYNASLSGFGFSGSPYCGVPKGATDDGSAANVCKYISFTVTNTDDSAITSGESLNVNATKTVKMTASYQTTNVSDGTPMLESDLPTQTVNVSFPSASFVYVQA